MKNLRWIFMLPVAYLTLFSCNNDDDAQPKSNYDNDIKVTLEKTHKKIDSLSLSGHADEDFALAMVVHHQGAIDMADVELEKGTNDALKTIAQQIKTRKTAERDSLTTWLIGRQPTRNATGEQFDAEMLAALDVAKSQVSSNLVNAADHDYATLMIVHNDALVKIAQSIVKLGHHDDMKAWARQMITDQQNSTAELNSWLSTNQN